MSAYERRLFPIPAEAIAAVQIEGYKRRRHAISLTPLIDVVFILLVFFMLATSFTDWRPVTLATGIGASSQGQKPPAVIRVAPDGTLSYDGRDYGVDELVATLTAGRQRGHIAAVVVAPATDTPLAVTLHVLDALTGAGVKPVSLAAGDGS